MSARRKLLPVLAAASLVLMAPLPATAPAAASVTITAPVNPNIVVQDDFQGFGTSLAWWADVLGGWNEPERSVLLDYLFTDSFALGGQTVQGLNLNVVRYNLGASEPGVTYEVVEPHLPPRNGAWLESFIGANGSYNWTVDANQRWVLEQAALRGVDTFEMFANSAPWFMTHSGHPAGRYSHNSPQGCSHSNLRPEFLDDFVDYQATVAERFATVGVDGPGSTTVVFDTIEPFNEPSNGWWCWGNNQEGMYLSAGEQSDIIVGLRSELDSRSIDTQISATNSNNYALVTAEYEAMTPAARQALGQINAHGYAGESPAPIRRHVRANDMRFWQAEWGPAEWGGYSINSELDAALELAARVTNDLTYVEANAWLYWQAIEDSTRGDGPFFWGLIQAPLDGSAQTYDIQKQFYALGQYSKFITANHQIIDSGNGKTVAAYDRDADELVLVTYNNTADDLPIAYDLSRFAVAGGTAEVWRTSATEDLAQLASTTVNGTTLSATVPPNSLVTHIVEGVYAAADTVTAEIINDSSAAISYAGNWSHTTYTGAGQGAYGLWDQDEHSAQTANATATATFHGTGVSLFATIAPSSGLIAVSVDGGPETTVNLHNTVRVDGVHAWSSGNLAPGRHTLQIRVLGQPGASGGGVWGNIDRLVVENSDWTHCADEGQTCSFNGTAEVRYGAQGGFVRAIHSDDIACTSAAFGDPTPGTAKSCYYSNVDTSSLVAAHSGRCAGVSASGTSPGADVIQWDCVGVADQEWTLDAAPAGYRLIPGHAPTMCLSVAGSSVAPGADVVQQPCGTALSQQWGFEHVRDGNYRLTPAHASGICLDVSGESTSNGADIVQYTCHGYDNQLWKLNTP